MRASFCKIRSIYARLMLAATMVAGLCCFAIMWVIDANALSRKVLNQPLPAALEITQSLLVLAIMLPFAYTLYRREHVNTVFLTSHFPAGVRRWLHLLWMLAGCVLFAAITWGAWTYGLRSWRLNEQTWGAAIQFPLWPAKMAVALAALMICVQFLLEAVGTLLIADFHQTPPGDEEPGLHV